MRVPNRTHGRPLQTGPGRLCCRFLTLYVTVGVLIVCLPARGEAQGGVTVMGVVENETGAAIPDMRFTLTMMPRRLVIDTRGRASFQRDHETVSDSLGRFSFPNVAPGLYVLEARAGGTEEVDVFVAVGVEPLVPLKITVDGGRLDERLPADGPAPEVPPLESTDIARNIADPIRPAIVAERPAVVRHIWQRDSFATAPAQAGQDGAAEAQAAPDAEDGQSQPPLPEQARPLRLPRLWSVDLILSNVFDSNIDRETLGVNAYGVLFGAGLNFQTNRSRPLLQVSYDVTRHSYPRAPRWSRLSHHVSATMERRLTRNLTLEALSEFVSGTTSEDQEIVNQYLVRPRVEYRLPRGHRVRFYAAHRLKRYAASAARDATNRYVGIELQQRLEWGDRWQIGYRYEQNRAGVPRYDYRRLTYETEYTTVLTGSDTVTLNVKYRSKRYPQRLVEVDDVDVPKLNQRWIPSVWWAHRMGPQLEVRLEYDLETQSSNDLDEPYTAHNTGLAFRYRW